MNETLAFYATRTVPGYPLGQPVDGRLRYGMTPEQACLYRWLVLQKPHAKPFALNSRSIAWLFHQSSHTGILRLVRGLIERGWLERDDAGYRFVHPVMHFAEPRHG
jgi:hypothetical protein